MYYSAKTKFTSAYVLVVPEILKGDPPFTSFKYNKGKTVPSPPALK
tara:strand:+ start:86 stop:223 length:138 start_codon:yes stop_codon:yes gene_type:complete